MCCCCVSCGLFCCCCCFCVTCALFSCLCCFSCKLFSGWLPCPSWCFFSSFLRFLLLCFSFFGCCSEFGVEAAVEGFAKFRFFAYSSNNFLISAMVTLRWLESVIFFLARRCAAHRFLTSFDIAKLCTKEDAKVKPLN
uniref:Secreted protein n=1 Tax=Arundo donax TaxID=35708 RepID=A0A0A8YND5_ARUDO